LCNMATLSVISKILGTSWLIITPVYPYFAWVDFMRSCIELVITGSRPVVGSSKRTMTGSEISALAKATLFSCRRLIPQDTSSPSL
jgi:hypothetical protein